MLKKILAFSVAALVIALCLVGCNSEKVDTPTDAPTEAPTEKAPVKAAVRVIYPDGGFKKPALKVQDKIMSIKGSSLENMGFCTLSTDSKSEDDGTFEILVGHTDRAISEEARAELKTYLDFAVLYKDNKLAISANNEAQLLVAVEYVLDKLTLENDKVVYSGDEKYVKPYTNYEMQNISIGGTAISEFKIVYPAKANTAELSLAEQLGDWLMSMCGEFIEIVDDSTAESANEILIGKTNRALSTEIVGEDALPEMQFASLIKDGKLAINADSASGYTESLKGFKNAMTKNEGNITEPFGDKWLTFDEIIEISVGSPNIKIENGAVYFYKATDEQMEAYGPEGSGMRNNATGSTGVRLDFTTDSSTFSFKAASGGRFGLFINGNFVTQITNATTQIFNMTLDTGKGENRITLFLPNGGTGAISMLKLDYGATCKRQEFDSKFLIIGDSITQAWPTAIDANGYGHLISMHYNADSIIYGVGGGIFDYKILGTTPECDPDVITVAFGTNDWARSYNAETLENNMKAFLNKLKELYPDAKIIGITPLWRKDAGSNKAMTFDEACDLIASVYEEYGIPCIDGDALVSHEDVNYADDVHPNDTGHEEYAKNLIKALDLYL